MAMFEIKPYMLKNITIIKLLADYRLLEIFVIAFISAVPMAFLNSNVIVWLKESGIDIALITLFTFSRLPSSLRFLWAPFIDNYRLRFPVNLGHRKKWFILCTLILSVLILIISTVSPPSSLKLLFMLCVAVTFISATYDINFDAYRIEIFGAEKQSLGAAAAVLGYRAGVNIVGFGGLNIASYTGSWPITIRFISYFLFMAVFIILLFVRNKNRSYEPTEIRFSSLKQLISTPFHDFFKMKHAILILIGVILYKVGESMSTVLILPYYLSVGFSKSQISDAIRIFGFSFSIIGIGLGAIIMYIFNPIRGLIFSGVVQVGMVLVFIWLKYHKAEKAALYVAVITENICEGIASVALMCYLSSICNKKYLASQYALLISASGIFGNTICSYSGKLIEILDWEKFFICAIVASLPSLIIFVYLDYKNNTKTPFKPRN